MASNNHSESLGVLPPDFSSIKSVVPDSHAWPELSNGEQVIDRDGGSSIPIIDLMDPNALELIGQACENWGAFQLKNHGIPLSLIEEVEAETKRLFDLPSQQKLKALRSPDSPSGYGTALITPFFEKVMWHEGFTILGSPVDNARKIWPHDYKHFCDVMEKFEEQMRVLTEKLVQLTFRYLGICEEEEKNWIGSSNHGGAVQLNSYPPCPEPERALGIAAHTDTSMFTVLHQSLNSGLQVFKEGVGWVKVPLDPTALVVNTGDIIHVMSNGTFKSVLHRVTANKNQRYSMVYFYTPTKDALVSPLLHHSKPLYRGLTFKEFADIKSKHLNKVFSMITST